MRHQSSSRCVADLYWLKLQLSAHVILYPGGCPIKNNNTSSVLFAWHTTMCSLENSRSATEFSNFSSLRNESISWRPRRSLHLNVTKHFKDKALHALQCALFPSTGAKVTNTGTVWQSWNRGDLIHGHFDRNIFLTFSSWCCGWIYSTQNLARH